MTRPSKETSFTVQPVKRSGSLTAHVANELESMINSGKISVGQKLPPESGLCEMFDVSRTVIREAITQLKSLGLVETRRGVGTTVVRGQAMEKPLVYTIDLAVVDDILNILELRMSVEDSAAELAAARRDELDLENIEAALVAFDKALAAGELARQEDFAFHLSIIKATKNPFFIKFYEQFNRSVIPRTKLLKANVDNKASAEYLERIGQEHHEIFAAIRAADPAAAKKAMHMHLYRAYHVYEKYKIEDEFE